MKKSNYFAFILSLVILITGCAPFVAIGLVGAGCVTGYGLSNDSAVGNVKMDYHSLWEMCLDKLTAMEADIYYSNESKGLFKVFTSEYRVTIHIDSFGPETQRLKVSARKFYMPKPQFAQKIFFKLLEDLEDLEERG
ncbi:MAG: hypothetical protein PHP69_00780 [Candidatus Omnitrophica bacterium]|jgi:hypothetical protein|nr:hypothetical protein [Candidatus Omnitrophota bacterium]MDD5080943.1 hypothetical protein [Candidatus Omnitrophota bacterium]MDD5440586.1 hypothetical protein [Candidatus Omnitrophota bacterium]